MTPLDPRNALGEFYLRMAEEVSRLSVKVAKGDDLSLDKVLTRLHRIVREMGLSGGEREAAELRIKHELEKAKTSKSVTLDKMQAKAEIDRQVETLKQQGLKQLSGEVSFRLYDTYGFPLDLTSDIVAEEGMNVDEEGFHRAMDEQRERARKSWKGSRDEAVDVILKEGLLRGMRSDFTGYESTEATATALTILRDGTPSFTFGRRT